VTEEYQAWPKTVIGHWWPRCARGQTSEIQNANGSEQGLRATRITTNTKNSISSMK
jgi:hypothetical protein